MIDMSRFKVVYDNRLYNAIEIQSFMLEDGAYEDIRKPIEKIKELEILAINEDGNMISIRDEAKKFQFIPII